MKSLFLVLLALNISLSADMIKNKALACPTLEALTKAPINSQSELLDLEKYSISNNCVILNRGDSVKAIGYDPRNSKEIYQEIIYKKTGTKLFILRSAMQVEQGGKKNIMRF